MLAPIEFEFSILDLPHVANVIGVLDTLSEELDGWSK
jgi:hypothetical protein